MSAVTASIAAGNAAQGKEKGTSAFGGGGGAFGIKGVMERVKAAQANKGKVPKHGDEAHTGGGVVGNEDVVADASAVGPAGEEVVNDKDSAIAFKNTSPAKIANVGYNNPDYKQSSPTGYAPFRMAAADHNNSPIEKNYGTPAQRGMFTGGVGAGNTEMNSGVGAKFDSVGKYASPAKGFFSSIKNFAKKAMDPLGLKKKLFGGREGPAADGVTPHGDEVHTSGGGDGSGGVGNGVEEALDPQAAKKQEMLAKIKERGIGKLFPGQGGGGGWGGMFS